MFTLHLCAQAYLHTCSVQKGRTTCVHVCVQMHTECVCELTLYVCAYIHVEVEVVKRTRLLPQWTGEWEEEGVCLWVEFGSSDLLAYLNHCPLPRLAPMNLNEINTRSCD